MIDTDENIVKFMNGEANVLLLTLKNGDKFQITREKQSSTGVEFITEKIIQGDRELEFRKFWHNPNKNANNEKPKHTGGKKPYLMLMIAEIEGLRKSGTENVEELIGFMVCLGNNIEWGTGKLIHKRSKKPLQYKDLLVTFKCSNSKLNRILKAMKKHNLLFYTDEGYFVSQKYIKKGKENRKG